MKILQSDITPTGLAEHACRVVTMFKGQRFAELIDDYGYAVANGRDPVVAIREDFERALLGAAATEYANIQFVPDPIAEANFRAYASNELGIVATYECIRIARNGDRVAVFDLVVFGNLHIGYDVGVEDLYEHRFATE
jgi:hypothetical protein